MAAQHVPPYCLLPVDSRRQTGMFPLFINFIFGLSSFLELGCRKILLAISWVNLGQKRNKEMFEIDRSLNSQRMIGTSRCFTAQGDLWVIIFRLHNPIYVWFIGRASLGTTKDHKRRRIRLVTKICANRNNQHPHLWHLLGVTKHLWACPECNDVDFLTAIIITNPPKAEFSVKTFVLMFRSSKTITRPSRD